MPNLYGVAQPNPQPTAALTIGSVDINCPAGLETNFMSFQSVYPMSPGVYYPVAWGWVTIVCGAAIPNTFSIGFRVNGGADLFQWVYYPGVFVANESFCLPFAFMQPGLYYNYPVPVVNFQTAIGPGANAVTAKNNGTLCYGQFIRAPDQ